MPDFDSIEIATQPLPELQHAPVYDPEAIPVRRSDDSEQRSKLARALGESLTKERALRQEIDLLKSRIRMLELSLGGRQ